MTRRVRFYLVDVFASRPLTGNPLSLVPDAVRLPRPESRSAGPGTTRWAWLWLEAAGRLASAAARRDLQQEIAGQLLPVEVLREPGPATGTAAGPLAAWLVAAGRVPDGSTVIIEQGHALGRPSRIAVSVSGPRVRVGGSGLVVAEGMLDV